VLKVDNIALQERETVGIEARKSSRHDSLRKHRKLRVRLDGDNLKRRSSERRLNFEMSFISAEMKSVDGSFRMLNVKCL
jgi:hypothetical protein